MFSLVAFVKTINNLENVFEKYKQYIIALM